MTGSPASGKSSIARNIARAIKVIRGDILLCEIGDNPEAYGKLGELIGKLNRQRMDLAMRRLCNKEGLELFARLVAERAGGESFIYDGFIPHEYTDQFALILESQGFRVCRLETPAPALSPNEQSKRARIEARKYQMFLNALESARKISKLR